MDVYFTSFQSSAINFSCSDGNLDCRRLSFLRNDNLQSVARIPDYAADFDRKSYEFKSGENGTMYNLNVEQLQVNKTPVDCRGSKKDRRSIDIRELKAYHPAQPLAPMLPPCRVCGEKASGFHYGANTCEACKGFFRRSLYRKESYQCLGSNNCIILPGKRNICASCRYKKCISIGMSKNAIKTGRYTHEKKSRDIREVKRLQRQQQERENVAISTEGQMCGNSSVTLNEQNVNEIVERIMTIHRLQTPHTRDFFDKLPSKEQEYLTSRQLQENVFGSLKPIAYQEYFKIYHITGIDLDGRKAMMEHMIPCIEKAVKRFVAFAKAIPGFKEFPIDDQIKLIKGSRFEAWLISTYRAFNADHLIYTHFCGYTVHLEDMARIYDDHFIHSVFKVANMIKRLDLSEDEECILKAVLLLFRDRSPLQAPEQVESSQLQMIDVLQHIHGRRKPNDKNFFARVIAVLIELRTLTDLHTVQENKINMEWATNFQMPPLLYDLFSV